MLHRMKLAQLPSLLLALSLLGPASAPARAAQASAAATSVPNALDTPYAGVIHLSVDLRDTQQRIFKIHESIPVQPGPVMLLYPKWIPGEHGPTGPIDSVVGLKIS